ncbi:hypothetical protein, conserved [Plasmodium gonderi]|uniref:peptidylprolyl isomerase n=1 Tax=Plasmodium gonderi TaxID=77519 RepID=A0A1Y1JPT9_PLAGO|nr:hypothetical protein, conserved [Plasmodium gonderi]GAW83508.1 hypothetical protein, conserved [Plasmodium gonderi]
MDSLLESCTQSNLRNLKEGNIKYDHTLDEEKEGNENIDTDVYDSENNESSKSYLKKKSVSGEQKDCSNNSGVENDKKKNLINESPLDVEENQKKFAKDSLNTEYSEDENEKETKDDANEKYNKGDYEGAVKIWERGLRSINYVLSKKEELNNERLEAFQKLQSTYCSNIAQGYMKLNKYSECVKYSLLAQENDKKNVKIYFRLAKGYFMLGEFDKAIQILNEGIKIDNDFALVNLLALVKRKKHLHLKKEKHMMRHIFDNLKNKPLINDKDCTNSFFKPVYSLISVLLMFVCAFFARLSSLLVRIFKKCKMKSS